MSEGSSSSFSLYSLLGVAGVSIIVGFGIGSYLNKSKSTKLRKDQLKKTSIESDIGSDDEVFEDTIPTEKYKMVINQKKKKKKPLFFATNTKTKLHVNPIT